MAQRAAAEAAGGSWCARGYNCGGSRRTEAVHGRSSGKTSLARDCGGGDKLQRLTKRPAVDTRWLKVEVTRRCGRARSGSTVRSAWLRARLEWFDGSGGAEARLWQRAGGRPSQGVLCWSWRSGAAEIARRADEGSPGCGRLCM